MLDIEELLLLLLLLWWLWWLLLLSLLLLLCCCCCCCCPSACCAYADKPEAVMHVLCAILLQGHDGRHDKVLHVLQNSSGLAHNLKQIASSLSAAPSSQAQTSEQVRFYVDRHPCSADSFDNAFHLNATQKRCCDSLKSLAGMLACDAIRCQWFCFATLFSSKVVKHLQQHKGILHFQKDSRPQYFARARPHHQAKQTESRRYCERDLMTCGE